MSDLVTAILKGAAVTLVFIGGLAGFAYGLANWVDFILSRLKANSFEVFFIMINAPIIAAFFAAAVWGFALRGRK